MSSEHLHPNLVLERHGAIEIVRVDREEVLGALNFNIQAALGDYVTDLAQRKDEVRVLILTGTGRGFVAGADIADYLGASQTLCPLVGVGPTLSTPTLGAPAACHPRSSSHATCSPRIACSAC